MIIGIDASNIRSGGGLTHLVELIKNVKPEEHNIRHIIVWACKSTLDSIDDEPWILKRNYEVLEKNFISRAIWQWKNLKKLLVKEKCSILFVPGGSFVTNFRPIVTMNQNLLPFEYREIFRYGFSLSMFKFLLLRIAQKFSFKNSNGIIFLSKYAEKVVMKKIGGYIGTKKTIPHGLDKRFFVNPEQRKSTPSKEYKKSIKIVYVSSIEPYKHQWNVVEAVSSLISKGHKIQLDFIGPPNQKYLKKLNKSIKRNLKSTSSIKYHGIVKHQKIQKIYLQSDIAVFASSCETFGQILIEGMASSLPTACSNMSTMPEILGDAGEYFDPLNSKSIELALYKLIISPKLRAEYSHKSFAKAKNYSWKKCSSQTFSYLKETENLFWEKNEKDI